MAANFMVGLLSLYSTGKTEVDKKCMLQGSHESVTYGSSKYIWSGPKKRSRTRHILNMKWESYSFCLIILHFCKQEENISVEYKWQNMHTYTWACRNPWCQVTLNFWQHLTFCAYYSYVLYLCTSFCNTCGLTCGNK